MQILLSEGECEGLWGCLCVLQFVWSASIEGRRILDTEFEQSLRNSPSLPTCKIHLKVVFEYSGTAVSPVASWQEGPGLPV